MKNNPRSGRAGFTLIELMAVITIIIILAGLVVGGMGFVTERQAKEKARVQLALLTKALEEYKLDMGTYPQTGSVVDTAIAGTGMTTRLYQCLFYEGYEYSKNPDRADNPNNPKANKIYLPELDPRTSKQGWVTTATAADPPATSTIIDPWGTEYRYRKGANAQNPDFDLWSCGKDATTNPNDPSLKTPATKNLNRDDIRNF